MARIYDRKNKTFYEDKQYGGKALNFLYGNILGRIILRLFIAGKGYSRLNAKRNSTRKSTEKIAPFVKEYGIVMSDFEDREYSSFSDFFTRKLADGKRVFSAEKNDLISVADSKLLCYRITDDGKIPIKNSIYTAREIIDEDLTTDFYGGYCLVFRLTVDDYHRYCFFDDGKLIRSKYINGKLHTVSPISSKKYKVFSENFRSVSYIETENFGTCYQIEIGALLVGKIINYSAESFFKGEEKGYFEMGGSTCVVMVKKGTVTIDADILENSEKGIETKVLIGERIGKKNAQAT
ncbi:MAG TPA: phosphatidylserine decarboxylase [Clostridiaceae bacterium]|jgi:phosphatidylserine decarboxylase|nr:phosphatidylserine decarboxylase [Clostridiaceae bacterium]